MGKVVVSNNQNKNSDFLKQRHIKSFSAKLSQADDQIRNYYKELKSYILSYFKANSRISWHYDAINVGNNQVAKFAIRGKTLCLYLSIDKVDKKYKVEKASSFRFGETPLLYRIRNDKRCRYAKELIDMVMKNVNSKKGKQVDEIILPKYEDDESLLKKGLIKELRG